MKIFHKPFFKSKDDNEKTKTYTSAKEKNSEVDFKTGVFWIVRFL